MNHTTIIFYCILVYVVSLLKELSKPKASLAKLGKASQAFEWATDAKEEEKSSKSCDCADLH